ncbi:MAG: hypothetical protein US57_C0006G0009 [Candidatus Moranbacteria bacterium GW2011_GWC2_37_73]|nr:MAG: hypothetical protein UR95_C0007G0013 [Parcubacteria group bacterium GW2011_GWC1_36_108]KKQ00064.1 MAG: hypothetical protein US09_C0022G0010 [Candidatus Moranbacteria bacterium GW2011_GWD1_36_198]KKQ01154.1 MAG: hypothetical protein US10_C0021G0012 [Candidatus Moranbacteria bacterium GW2011_GWD2_36_198]KKQ39937.1 MAG: hypothetical protein US57_C0006G0009 [Candidatus Moranbacteria bacterium GW2011_GWC2_37_73]HAR99686.1 hypothetical protein [Candidatus Moranbacteria bacterium]
MIRKILAVVPIFVAVFFLSGCGLSDTVAPKATMANATFIKTEDGGTSWNPKMKIDDKQLISGIDVLSMAIHPTDQNIIYISTDSNGLFVTKDAGETWAAVKYPDKAYGLVFDPKNGDIMYGSGVFEGRAKIFKRLAEGQEWKEIYTEPADGTIISSLAISSVNSNVLYAGTNAGIIIKTTDGGQTWVNLKINQDINAPITSIVFDKVNDQHVLFALFQGGILETKNAGASIENITDQIDTKGNTTSVYSLVADPYLGGVAYAGTGTGIFRRNTDGSWNSLNLIESSKAFAIRSIAINPKNSREIMYSSAKAIYKSTDGGVKWATFQLDTSKDISILKYDQMDPAKIYAGMRSF